MVVIMRPDASEQQVQQVIDRVREMGLKDHVIVGKDLTVIAVIGDDRKKDQGTLEAIEGVDRVVPILAPYKIAAFESKKKRTEVPISAQCVVGGKKVQVIAGPCSVESQEQIMTVARQVKAAGATALRGGAFKPRTNPYSFQGLGEEGLKLMAAARDETGLAVVTEVNRADGRSAAGREMGIDPLGPEIKQSVPIPAVAAVVRVDRPFHIFTGYGNRLEAGCGETETADFLQRLGTPHFECAFIRIE